MLHHTADEGKVGPTFRPSTLLLLCICMCVYVRVWLAPGNQVLPDDLGVLP